jgi:hypothetical protein
MTKDLNAFCQKRLNTGHAWVSVLESLPIPWRDVIYLTDDHEALGHINSRGDWSRTSGSLESATVRYWQDAGGIPLL